MQTLSEIRAILAERGLRPKHRLGQHFLHDKNHLRRLVQAAQIERGALVLEVGPGTGTLTEALLDAGAEVVACEVDGDLAGVIADRFGDRLRLVHGDCMQRGTLNATVVEALGGRPFKLVANLPFQVAAALIAALVLRHPGCRGQFITIQREVADRLHARPRTKEYGPLSVIVGALCEVRRIGLVKPTCFWPPPEVDSAMCAILPRPDHPIDDPQALARFVRRVFVTRRKQLGGILGRSFKQWPQGVTPDLRPEALSVQQIIALWQAVG